MKLPQCPSFVLFKKMECQPVCRAVFHCYVLFYSVLYCSTPKFITPRRSVLYSASSYLNYWLTLRFYTITVRNLLDSTVLQDKCTVIDLHCTALYFHGLHHTFNCSALLNSLVQNAHFCLRRGKTPLASSRINTSRQLPHSKLC
jgi:hypothetical protein